MRYFDESEKNKKEKRLLDHPEWIRRLFNKLPSVHDVYDGLLSPYIQKNNTLLDAGCGKKGIMNNYAGKLKYAIGIDISFLALQQNYSLDAYVQGGLDHLPFVDEAFDIIISQWAIEHIPDPEACFMEFYRVLKKGGGIILVTNSIYHPLMFFSSRFPEKIRDAIKVKLLPTEIEEETFPTYYRCNSLKKMEMVLGGIGFKKVFDCYVGDPSFFIFSKPLFPLLLFYEKITNIAFLRRLKMHVVVHYVK